MNNEERILEMLTKLTETVNHQGETLAKQGEQLDRMEAVQAEHTEHLDTLDARSLKSAVLLETDIPHQLGLLFEGHKTILETLSPKSRVEELEEEVTILRSAFQALANRLAALEKAQ